MLLCIAFIYLLFTPLKWPSFPNRPRFLGVNYAISTLHLTTQISSCLFFGLDFPFLFCPESHRPVTKKTGGLDRTVKHTSLHHLCFSSQVAFLPCCLSVHLVHCSSKKNREIEQMSTVSLPYLRNNFPDHLALLFPFKTLKQMQSTLVESKKQRQKIYSEIPNSEKDKFAAAAPAFVASNKLKIKSNILMLLF